MSESMQTEMSRAITQVALLSERLHVFEQQTRTARQNETDCRNELNAAQKKVDDLVGILKKQAGRDTYWKEGAL